MLTKTTIKILIGSLLVSMMISCSGKAEKVIIGKWGGDIEGLVKDERYTEKKVKESAKEILEQMMTSLTMEITSDTVTSSMSGRETKTRYKILSSSDDKVLVEATDGISKGAKITFTIINNSHITMTEEKNPGIIYLKRL